jgi:hypothetical protein
MSLYDAYFAEVLHILIFEIHWLLLEAIFTAQDLFSDETACLYFSLLPTNVLQCFLKMVHWGSLA